MAADPTLPDDLPARARAILREYGGPPIIADLADEIERLRMALFLSDTGGTWSHLYDADLERSKIQSVVDRMERE